MEKIPTSFEENKERLKELVERRKEILSKLTPEEAEELGEIEHEMRKLT